MMSDRRSCVVLLFFAALSSAFILETFGMPSIRSQYKRYRDSLGKRNFEQTEKRMGFRADLGKRSGYWNGPAEFRTDMGKRLAEMNADLDGLSQDDRYSSEVMNAIKRRGRLGFRADLGKRTLERLGEVAENTGSQTWQSKFVPQVSFEEDPLSEKRAYFRSDLGKRSTREDEDILDALDNRLLTA